MAPRRTGAMQDTELYHYLLGIEEPWTVERVTLDMENQRGDVWVTHPQESGWPSMCFGSVTSWGRLGFCGSVGTRRGTSWNERSSEGCWPRDSGRVPGSGWMRSRLGRGTSISRWFVTWIRGRWSIFLMIVSKGVWMAIIKGFRRSNGKGLRPWPWIFGTLTLPRRGAMCRRQRRRLSLIVI